ncbi:DoxX family membrane protein [Salegentibacter sp. F14]
MKTKILNMLAALLALILINSGLNKFFNYMPVPEDLPSAIIKDNEALREIAWLIPLIAIAEILGGLLLLFPRTRALGVLVVFPVMVGILLTHIFVAPEGLFLAVFLWAVLLWIIFEYKKKYYPLIS